MEPSSTSLAINNWRVISLLVMVLAGLALMLVVLLSDRSHAPQISASQIQQLQSDESQQDRFVIIDVRSKAETDVSMIPGALTKSEFEQSASQHQGKTLIVYCTIGFRSGKYAASLNQQGWRALNYKGSILDWCKNKLPLKTPDGKSTAQVHTYSARYSAPQDYIGVR